MKLGARIIDSASTLNNIKYLSSSSINPGETVTLYFQLVDLDSVQESCKLGTRFLPSSEAAVSVEIFSVNKTNILTKNASMVFPSDDRSIWKIDLDATETSNMSGVNLKITVTDGTNIKIGYALNAIIVSAKSIYQC